jgi:LCP family protein required for cell wall assembly
VSGEEAGTLGPSPVPRRPWGREVVGGRPRRGLRRLATLLGAVVVLGGSVTGASGAMLLRQAEASLTRIPVPDLDVVASTARPSSFLVVGSDSRAGLSATDRAALRLGDFSGQQSDVLIYVAISERRDTVTLVSLPRDLLVLDDDGVPRKLTETFAGGPDPLIRAVRRNLDLPVNHFAMLSLGGFIDVVRTLGTVRICLEQPLVDRKSGADFEAGCHDMDARESLSFVRSRVGPGAHSAPLDRQQQFLRSVLAGLVDTRLLADPARVYRLTEEVAGNLVTDDRLQLDDMRTVALELLPVVRDGLPMVTLPSYPRTVGGRAYVLPYGPGARALLEDLRAGRPPEPRGTAEARRQTTVALYSGGRPLGAEIVQDTLLTAGFRSLGTMGPGPARLDALGTTTVYAAPEEEVRAAWVAAVLGAPLLPLPEGFRPPAGVVAVVAIGDDATS